MSRLMPAEMAVGGSAVKWVWRDLWAAAGGTARWSLERRRATAVFATANMCSNLALWSAGMSAFLDREPAAPQVWVVETRRRASVVLLSMCENWGRASSIRMHPAKLPGAAVDV